MRLVAKASAVTVIALLAVFAGASSASANTAPNPYTPTGSAWVNVPTADRVYLENFGSSFDDYSFASVPAGVTCTLNSVTAVGPFLTGSELDDTDCVDASSTPYDPYDEATRLGALDFGFDINFFGTTYNSAWPSSNGSLYFGSPETDYDETLAEFATNTDGPAMHPLGGDLEYVPTDSNFWTAQTIVDGHPAVVFSWEKFNSCCGDAIVGDGLSFQLVLISAGNGDFNAEFNYSSFTGFTEGYSGPTFLVDLATGVTPGSNIVVANNVTNVTAACTPGYVNTGIGNVTDGAFVDALQNQTFYFALADATARTVSLWSDAACTVPVNSNVVQDTATDGFASMELADDNSPISAVGTGWSFADQTTGLLSTTEFVQNVDTAELENGLPGALNQRSLNSTVAGRFLIGQRGGVTVTDPARLAISAAAAPALAATGSNTDLGVVGTLVAAMLLLGATGLIIGRRARTI